MAKIRGDRMIQGDNVDCLQQNVDSNRHLAIRSKYFGILHRFHYNLYIIRKN